MSRRRSAATARTPGPEPPFRERLRSATIPAAALLPVRFFFGATFLYAGIDKLLDAGFFDPASPTSIHAQMAGFARGSPLGELIRLVLPEAAGIGLLIAVAEIGIGLGALTGLAYRVAATGGALISLLFFLTVSWRTYPYYLGSDLPYAVGWLTLAIAGHGGILVPRRLTNRAEGRARRPDGRRRSPRVRPRNDVRSCRRASSPWRRSPSHRLRSRCGSLGWSTARRPTAPSGSIPATVEHAPPPTGLAVSRIAPTSTSAAPRHHSDPFDTPPPPSQTPASSSD